MTIDPSLVYKRTLYDVSMLGDQLDDCIPLLYITFNIYAEDGTVAIARGGVEIGARASTLRHVPSSLNETEQFALQIHHTVEIVKFFL